MVASHPHTKNMYNAQYWYSLIMQW
jgi:hypothetical protein